MLSRALTSSRRLTFSRIGRDGVGAVIARSVSISDMASIVKLFKNPDLLNLAEEFKDMKDPKLLAIKLKGVLDKNPSIAQAIIPAVSDPKVMEAMNKVMENETMRKKVTELQNEFANIVTPTSPKK
jgi:hypothetical protein